MSKVLIWLGEELRGWKWPYLV